MRLAILISNAGTGSNLQAILDAIRGKILDAKISIVVSDKKDAYGLNRAKKAKVKTYVFNSEKENLIELLEKKFPSDYVVLAGWKRIIPDNFIDVFKNKIINIHPGLIPDSLDSYVLNPDGTIALWNRGKFTENAIKQFLKNATYAGSTIHFLSHEFDFGLVLARTFEKVKNNDTVVDLYKRLKKKEHKILVEALKKL